MNTVFSITYAIVLVCFIIWDWRMLNSRTKFERILCIGLYSISLLLFLYAWIRWNMPDLIPAYI